MIVKNCPSCVGGVGCSSAKTTSADCAKVENCIIKQIVSALQSRTPEDNDKILNILEVE
ncbi:MAG: hypothetical protein IKY15_00055 [Clostridia bacterium]|nr:hypothetical protein [Clostridia bacterium]